MSYNHDKVTELLDKMSSEEKYEKGLEQIKKIWTQVDKLKSVYEIIDAQFVNRSDLATKKTDTKVKNGCESFLNTIGFFFQKTRQSNGDVIVKLDGEIGGMAQRNPDAENICKRFENFNAEPNDIFNWVSALDKGFVEPPRVQAGSMNSIYEARDVQNAETIMKTAVKRIWRYIQEFRKLKISEL